MRAGASCAWWAASAPGFCGVRGTIAARSLALGASAPRVTDPRGLASLLVPAVANQSAQVVVNQLAQVVGNLLVQVVGSQLAQVAADHWITREALIPTQ